MFAKIGTTKSLSKTLCYNERKIESGKAERIVAENFVQYFVDLSRNHIYFQMKRWTSLNDKALKKTLHISLNFHSDENPSNRQMATITKEYMKKIGFDERPYVAYRHYDAAHA